MVKKKYYKKKSQSIFIRLHKVLIKYESDLHLLIILIILLVIFQILSVSANVVAKNAQVSKVAVASYELPVAPYLFLTSPVSQPVTAQSAIIIDRETKTALFEKNSHVRFSMASTTKLMTALVAVEYFKPSDILTAYTSNVEGVNVGLLLGEKLYFKDALYGMLLPSGNDVALMMAQNYPGGEEAFVKRMNQKAKDFHLVNTHFADPAGLDDDGNYTIASELAELAAHVSETREISEVTATKEMVISTVDGSQTFVLGNLNRLLGYYGVTGIKTGHTEGAGDVLITSTVLSGHTYIIVVMRSEDRFADTEVLLASLLTGVGAFTPRSFDNF